MHGEVGRSTQKNEMPRLSKSGTSAAVPITHMLGMLKKIMEKMSKHITTRLVCGSSPLTLPLVCSPQEVQWILWAELLFYEIQEHETFHDLCKLYVLLCLLYNTWTLSTHGKNFSARTVNKIFIESNFPAQSDRHEQAMFLGVVKLFYFTSHRACRSSLFTQQNDEDDERNPPPTMNSKLVILWQQRSNIKWKIHRTSTTSDP